MKRLFVTLPRWILGALMLIAIAINFANVIGRYLFGYALFWAEEVLVFMIAWGVFIALAAAGYQRAHLVMDLFSTRIGGRTRIALNTVITFTLLATCCFMVVQSYQVLALFMQSGVVSVSAGIPKVIPHSAVLIGFALTILAVLVRLRAYVTGKD